MQIARLTRFRTPCALTQGSVTDDDVSSNVVNRYAARGQSDDQITEIGRVIRWKLIERSGEETTKCADHRLSTIL